MRGSNIRKNAFSGYRTKCRQSFLAMASTALTWDRQLYSERDAPFIATPPSRSVVHDETDYFAQRFQPQSAYVALPASGGPAQSQVSTSNTGPACRFAAPG